jgi:hypothetical protein
MIEAPDLLNDVKEIVSWYHEFGSRAQLPELQDEKTKLVTVLFWFAEVVGDLKETYNKAYYNRKITVVKTVNKHVKDRSSVNKAEHLANEEHEKLFFEELEYEALADRMEILLRQANIIVQDMTQKITTLRGEKNESTNQNFT